ncbi:MAG TPA: AMP-binding protein [bacterium]|nr:AMP-binding protein [bacterium]HPN46248.1 AMP-binding protein [bacterium]
MKKKSRKILHLGIRTNGFRHTLVKRVLSPWRNYQNMLAASQWWSAAELQEYQWQRLQTLLRHAGRNVPWYQQLFRQYNIKPERIASPDDLQILPILEKQDLRRHHEQLAARNTLAPFLYRCYTSGTTGTPLTLYRDLHNIGFEHALLLRQLAWAGIGARERVAVLKGDTLPERLIAKHIFHVYSPADNRLVLSSFHISSRTITHYLEALRHYQPVALDGYPSAIYALANFFSEQHLHFPLKAVLTSSETLLPQHKQFIEKIFQCRVYDYYGMAERVAAIHSCERGSYHIIPEYGIVELPAADEDDSSYREIIATALTNMAMPLLRYRVGDLVQVNNDTPACPCGRAYPVVERIAGRADDYIVTPDGALVGRLDHIFKGSAHILGAQVYQPDTGHVILRIVRDENYVEQDGQQILNRLKARVNDGMQFEIEYINDLPRGGRGKFKAVVSDVQPFADVAAGGLK